MISGLCCQNKVKKKNTSRDAQGRPNYLPLWEGTPLGNKLAPGQLSALAMLGDETTKLAGMGRLAACLPGSLNQRKIILVNV